MYNPAINPVEIITVVALAVMFVTLVFTINGGKEVL